MGYGLARLSVGSYSVQDHRGLELLAVAALCALKAELVIRHYLEARRAGPVFHALVRLFALLAPVLPAASALREAALG